MRALCIYDGLFVAEWLPYYLFLWSYIHTEKSGIKHKNQETSRLRKWYIV